MLLCSTNKRLTTKYILPLIKTDCYNWRIQGQMEFIAICALSLGAYTQIHAFYSGIILDFPTTFCEVQYLNIVSFISVQRISKKVNNKSAIPI